MCSFYTSLHERLIADVADSYGTLAVKQECTLDIAVMQRRVRSEGLSFLTKALPKLGKELDRALSQGTLFAPRGFVLRPRSTIPKFLGWLFELVFSDSGEELSNASPRAIRDLRQCLYFLYKLAVPFTDEQEAAMLSGFRSTDSGLPDSVDSDSVISHARNFITNVFGSFDPYNIIPKHGPGAVATGEKNHEKHCFSRLYQAIDEVYPYSEYYHYSLGHLCDNPEHLGRLETQSAGTAKVVLVPKDSRGPRIISAEPLEYQWIQGGLGAKISSHLESNRWTAGHVNFTDQSINRRLALASSTSKKWVTLDMKDASDRVSVALVSELFRDCPTLLRCLMAIRTPATRLPNGDVVLMKKFAPMGSNLCFPIESIVFFALGVGLYMHRRLTAVPYVSRHHQFRYYAKLMWTATRRLYVYGDDIISLREDYPEMLQYFPKVGLMFNTDKCCTQGSFRESCGMDAYKGVDVTPLRLKRLWMNGRRQAPETICAYVAFSNAAYARGFHRVASDTSDAVTEILGPLPVLPERAHDPQSRTGCEYGVLALVRHYSHASIDTTKWQVRFNPDLQCREYRLLQAVPRKVIVGSDDWRMVLRRFTSPSERDDPGVFAMTRRITLKRVWRRLAIS